MARYINADEYKELLKQSADICKNSKDPFLEDEGKIFEKIIADLDEQPTADVQEVKHGKWVIEHFKVHTEATCSQCMENYRYQKGQYHMHFAKYCPNCGAKMDGKDDD